MHHASHFLGALHVLVEAESALVQLLNLHRATTVPHPDHACVLAIAVTPVAVVRRHRSGSPQPLQAFEQLSLIDDALLNTHNFTSQAAVSVF
ncbi:hypothetical protein M758_2G224500 [Ceratodon purpureus]|nr:hypothetical protein M758_2G224500 [Ceratodon purpureus]